LNFGYALVHHYQPATNEDDLIGRSVTLILRPGICNAIQVVPPQLEWSTMGGGQQTEIETKSIGLLDIHSIAASNAEDQNDDNRGDEVVEEEDDDDMQCFFSVTTKQGHVHVMEAITSDESLRLVAGIKNIVARLSKQLIVGDVHAVSDFYENSGEPDEIRLTPEEAMVRLSHSFFD
jgi:hypothetical protein